MAFIPITVNGAATAANSGPTVLAARNIVGTAQTAPVVNYDFLTNSGLGWFDALGYSWASFTFVPNNPVGGIITFYGTNDTTAAPAGKAMLVQDATLTAASASSALYSFSPTGTTVRQFVAPVTTRYIRAMVSTAFSSGTLQMSATLSQVAPPLNTQALSFGGPIGTGTDDFGSLTPNAGTNFLGSAGYGSGLINDMSITIAYGGSTNSSSVDITGQPTVMSFLVNVTAAPSAPGVYISVAQSSDNTTFYSIYDFEFIGAVGCYVSPAIRVNGPYIRYNYRFINTTGSLNITFTRAYKAGIAGLNYHNFFDGHLVGGSNQIAGQTSFVYDVSATEQVQMAIASVTATASTIFQLQGSQDAFQSYWYPIGSTLTVPFVGLGVTPLVSHNARWIRAYVATGSAAQQISYINFTAIGP